MRAVAVGTALVVVSVLGIGRAEARYYSAATANFLEADRAGVSQGPNRYSYVKDDPVNAADSSGRAAIYVNELASNTFHSFSKAWDDLFNTSIGQSLIGQTYAWTGTYFINEVVKPNVPHFLEKYPPIGQTGIGFGDDSGIGVTSCGTPYVKTEISTSLLLQHNRTAHRSDDYHPVAEIMAHEMGHFVGFLWFGFGNVAKYNDHPLIYRNELQKASDLGAMIGTDAAEQYRLEVGLEPGGQLDISEFK
jgi:hypothetical protein